MAVAVMRCTVGLGTPLPVPIAELERCSVRGTPDSKRTASTVS